MGVGKMAKPSKLYALLYKDDLVKFYRMKWYANKATYAYQWDTEKKRNVIIKNDDYKVVELVIAWPGQGVINAG
jgi:hypothetical protein